MRIPFSLKLKPFSLLKLITLKLILLISCQDLWASQTAIVTVEKAVIYADEEMTSSVGYVARGKKVKVADLARNKAQVYPIVVSGKIAYIRVSDISTQKENVEATRLVAERFQKNANEDRVKSSVTMAYFNYSSQMSIDETNGGIEDKDPMDWSGFSLRAHGLVERKWELQIVGNYLTTPEDDEQFKAVEAGLGVGYRFLELGRLSIRIDGQFLVIPWASYSHTRLFRVTGQGFSSGAGLSLNFRLTDHWGLDAFSSMYYTSISGFEPPDPFKAIDPVFMGTRSGVGLNYTF